MKMIVLMNHSLSEFQKQQAAKEHDIHKFCYPPAIVADTWANIPPDLYCITGTLHPVLEWIENVSHEGDWVLVQGDFGSVYSVVLHCQKLNLTPVYATTKRETKEKEENGITKKQSVFRHILFRKFSECTPLNT